MLADRVRLHLRAVAAQGAPITYQALAQQLELSPPNTIQQLTDALEVLMEQDAQADRPLIAALVVSKATGGRPRQGFFQCAQRIGRFQGDELGPEAASFWVDEFERAVAFWGTDSLD